MGEQIGREHSAGQTATLACLLEVTAPKPGNVHRGADFEDVAYIDFAASAVVIGPVLDQAAGLGVGATVLAGVRATRAVAATNTNLGTLLLLAPLAAVVAEQALVSGVGRVLAGLGAADARATYEAIRLAAPGGLGRAERMDIAEAPPPDLRAAMQAAADRDLVARQYTNGFQQIFEQAVPWLLETRKQTGSLTEAIVHTHVRLMAQFPDSLIARKCGRHLAEQSAARAAAVLAAGPPGGDAYLRALAELDFWLRADHHRRNPGTTADLLAATLFVALRDHDLRPPFH